MKTFSSLCLVGVAFIMYALTNMVHAQTPVNCSPLQNRVFYSYPKNSADRYVTYREKGFARGRNLVKGDSSVWQVDWKDNCTYSLKYLSGNTKMSPEVADFVKSHTLMYS